MLARISDTEICSGAQRPPEAEEAPPAGRLRRLGRRIAAWIATCRDYWAAASTYEDLARLSDGELARRGLNRATLGWDVCEGRERKEGGE
jgi:hypothetical protein